MKCINFETNSFNFENYDKNNIEHIKLLDQLESDTEIVEHVPTLCETIRSFNNKYNEDTMDGLGFIISNKENYIGALTIYDPNNRAMPIRMGILKEFRKKRYGQNILRELFDYISKTYDSPRIFFGSVEKKNEASIGAVKKAGFAADPYTLKEDIIDFSKLR